METAALILTTVTAVASASAAVLSCLLGRKTAQGNIIQVVPLQLTIFPQA